MANYWNYPTNYSNGTGIDSVGDFMFGYPNFITDNNFTMAVILIVYVSFIALGSLMGLGIGAVVASASFITAILSIYLWLGGYIDIWVPFILIVLSVGGAMASKEGGKF